jgi:hypothetical protein
MILIADDRMRAGLVSSLVIGYLSPQNASSLRPAADSAFATVRNRSRNFSIANSACSRRSH